MDEFLRDYFDGVDKLDLNNKEQLDMFKSCICKMEDMMENHEDIDELDMEWALDKMRMLIENLISQN